MRIRPVPSSISEEPVGFLRRFRQAPAWQRYGVAVLSVALAALLRWLLDPILGEHLPYMIFFLAVAVSAWLGGMGPALLAIGLAWLAADYFFGTPRFSLAEDKPEDWLEGALFVIVGACFAGMMRVQWRAQQKAETRREEALAQARLLAQEIQEHQRAAERLRHAEARNAELYQEATQANAAKDEFLAVLSHELRTPLMPVLLTTSWLESEANLPADVKASVEVIRHNIDLEARLIDDLLDVTRIARGKIELHREVVDVHHLVGHVITNYQGQAASRGLVIAQELQAQPSCVQADPARLQQVLWNLLQNAVKFTPAGGRITIRTRNEAAGGVVVEVADTGMGIEASRLEVIFKAFEQGGRSITRRFGGLGLGLAISKKVIELHGGQIVASSAGKDRGATFTVCLPGVTAAVSSLDSADPAPAADASPVDPGLNLHILLVEDHGSTAQVMARLLGTFGHEVTVAATAAAAVECAAEKSFDLLISDLGLPDGSGYDLMRLLQRQHPLKGIALSGYGMEADIAKSREAGFAEHITKPVDLQRLQAVIRRVTSG